jgi:hypothetical protein
MNRISFYCVATLLLSLNSLGVSAQKLVRIDGQPYYCNSEPVTIALIGAWKSRDKVIELETQVTHWQTRSELLELNIEQLELIVAAKDTIIEVADDVTELTEKEVKRLKRQAVAKWFKSTLGMVATGVTGLGVGIGIGVMVGR